MEAPEGKVLRCACSKGHSFLTLTEKPPYYGGGVVCDGCRKRIPSGEEFLHCKDCKEDYCSNCKFVAKKELEPADKSKGQKKGEDEPASVEKVQKEAAPAKEESQEKVPKEEAKDVKPDEKKEGDDPDKKKDGDNPDEKKDDDKPPEVPEKAGEE